MFSQKSKFLRTLLLVTCLTLVFAFVLALSACGKPEDKKEDEKQEPVTPVIEVTTDAVFTGDVTDDEIAEGLTVKRVAEDGTKSDVTFTVKSKTVSEDKTQIFIVIVVEGIEKTVTADYVPKEEDPIREDLKPLYEFLKAEGGKSFSIKLNASKTVGEETKDFGATVLVNVSENGKVEIKVSDGEDQTVAVYKDEIVFVKGKIIDLSKIIAHFKKTADDPELVCAYPPVEDNEEGTLVADFDGIEEILADPLTGAFATVSGALNMLDGIAESNALLSFGVNLTKADGKYIVEIKSDALLKALPMIIAMAVESENYENAVATVNSVVDALDNMLDGALKEGKVLLNVSFGIDGLSAEVSAKLTNEKTETVYECNFAVDLSAEAFEIVIPEGEDLVIDDVEVTATLKLGKVDVAASAVLHTSAILDFEGKDLLTANVKFMDTKDAIVFVLNDRYVFLDITGLAKQVSSDAGTVAFYNAFEIDGEPASFVDMIPELIGKLINGGSQEIDDGDEPQVIDDGGDDGEDDGETAPELVAGYKEFGLTSFEIGATEEELRESITVYIYDGVENYEEVTEYTIEGFDSSAYFYDEVTIKYGDYTAKLSVVIFDPENIELYSLAVDIENFVEENETKDDLRNHFTVYAEYIDKTEETIVKREVVEDYEIVEFTFGDRSVTITYNGIETEVDIPYDEPYNPEDPEDPADPEDPEEPSMTIADVIKYLRFVSVDLDGEEEIDLAKVIESAIESVKATYNENKELIQGVYEINETEDQFVIRVALNTEEGSNVLKVVNLFVGIPNEEGGFDDIGITELKALLYNAVKMAPEMFNAIFSTIIGEDLDTVLSDLYLEFGISVKDGVRVGFALNNGEGDDFFKFIVGVNTLPAGEQFVLSEETIESAKSFDELGKTVLPLALQIFGGLMTPPTEMIEG